MTLQNRCFDLQCEDRTTKKPNKVKKSAHLQSSVGSYPKIVHSRNMKKGRSDTPLS